MSVTATAKVDAKAINDLERDLAGIANGVPRALAAALNDTARKGKTNIVRRMQKELTLKRQSIAEVVTSHLTSARSDPIETNVTLSDKARPLFDFPHRAGKKGVTVRVRKNQPPEKYRHRFEATMKSGHKGIWNRAKARAKTKPLHWFDASGQQQVTHIPVASRRKDGKATVAGIAGRLPIYEAKGPSVTAVFTEVPGVMQEEVDKLTDYLLERLYSKADGLLKRRKADRPT